MKNFIINVMRVVLLSGICVACSDINELHEPYLSRGEQIYLGKVDSVHIYAGKNRVEAGLWFSDVRAKNLVVKYNGGVDSICVPMVRDEDRPLRSDSILIQIPNVNEATAATFTFIVYDANMKYKSLPVEVLGNSYGDIYQESIMNRILRNYAYEDGLLTLNWLSTGSSQIVETEIHYQDLAGVEQTVKLLPKETQTVVNAKEGTLIRYRSVFLPESTALDYFYTDYNEFEIVSEDID